MVEERHQPGDSNEAEKKWCGNPEDDSLTVSGVIRNAICFRIATLLDKIKLSEGKPEKHYDERDEDGPVWFQRRKIANPRSTDAQTQKQKGPTQQADAPILASIPSTSVVFRSSCDRISRQFFSPSL